ncbi:DNA polymerase III, subunit gamma and tau [Orientia chuto str. Dubai]|uniref:DNA polymerase III subunit gamma/tau n=1 Tax=Orientia chuto str. Dubai TaxID=1359168 RepID=A0A0F3MLC4_9RICK|nr:DNA polymerase III subunit gamma/tau [Candidatus Orientia mediorientalis]KJV56262.1 DNA polymerase III, subunit gamma and tau [Orientia chuto str. Dubai]
MSEKQSNYVVWARKYRPTAMAELIGQEVLTKVLTYSMITSQLSQAYLLSGIRGVGKTTTARIIAKTINCFQPVITSKTISACNSCNSCIAMKNNSHPDVNEIDAASRTGVDDVRRIIEDSEYKPLIAKYKIFIIDEVHMLSKSAFNALLKLLEEPPKHVIFIFATTEINKIPLTVVSRCQKFDLRRLDVNDIVQILSNILTKENISSSKEVLEFIAVKADGSARDAISLLEQARALMQNNTNAVSNSEPIEISLTTVEQMCGALDLGKLIKLLSIIIEKNAEKGINIVTDLYIGGSDFVICNQNILDLIGYLIKVKAIDGYAEPIYSSYNDVVNSIISKLTLARLTVIWQIFSKSIQELKISHNPRLCFEVTVIKAIYSFELPTPIDALRQIKTELTDTKSSNVNSSTVESLPTSINKYKLQSYSCYSTASNEKQLLNKSNNSSNYLTVLVNFLKYLNQVGEIDLYYYLMNEVSVIDITKSEVVLSNKGSNAKMNNKLKICLYKWKPNSWNIVTLKNDTKQPLKAELIQMFKSSKAWNLITTNFKEANVIDVIMNERQLVNI